MKKIVFTSLLLLSSLYAQNSSSYELGLELWSESSEGFLKSPQSNHYLKSTNSKINPTLFLDVKSSQERLNYKLQYTRIDNERYNSNIFDGIVYTNIFHKKTLLDLGLGFRYFDSQIDSRSFSKIIPNIYANLEHQPFDIDMKTLLEVIYSPIYGTNIDIKAGISYDFFTNFFTVLGYRYNKTRVNDTYDANIETSGVYFGLSYTFFQEQESKRVEEKTEEPLKSEVVVYDEDSDGVLDAQDRCSGTRERLKVNSYGCALSQLDSDKDGIDDKKDICPDTPRLFEVDAQGCVLDEDKDGVRDALDICPYTDSNESVDTQGCALNQLDSDGDRVTDDRDLCPDTLEEILVDENGCEKVVIDLSGFENIKFKKGSSRLTQESKKILQRLAKDLREHPNYSVKVEGHTSDAYRTWRVKKVPSDIKGEESIKRYLNTKISQKRADVVKKYLIGRGVKSKTITAVGYGPDRPKASNKSAEGRAKNRRVEIIIETLKR